MSCSAIINIDEGESMNRVTATGRFIWQPTVDFADSADMSASVGGLGNVSRHVSAISPTLHALSCFNEACSV